MSRSLCAGVLLAATLATCPAVRPAIAAFVDTPACRRDLIEADRLTHGIRVRSHSVRPGDTAAACRALRQNARDMTAARNLVDQCLTGRDRGENVAQMDATLEDYGYALEAHCGGTR